MGTIRENLINFLRLIRYGQWQDKLQHIVVASLVVFIFQERSSLLLVYLLQFLLYYYFACMYGYMINSIGDERSDKKVSKDYFLHFSRNFIFLITFIFGAASLYLPIVFFSHNGISLLAIIVFVLTSLYSLSPFRLKNKHIVGWLTAGITQYLPFLFFLYLIPNCKQLVLYLTGWLFCLGLITELAHQISDYENDKTTKTHSFVNFIGPKRASRLTYELWTLLGAYLLLPFFIIRELQFLNVFFVVLILFIYSHNMVRFSYHQLIGK